MTIYEELKAASVKLDHRGSNLYAEVTPLSSEIMARYRFKRGVTCFRDGKAKGVGGMWYDIPFAYDPIQNEKCEYTIKINQVKFRPTRK